MAPAVACVRRHVPDPPTLNAMLAQAPRPGPAALACARRWVPNPPTLTAMTGRYPRTVQSDLSAADFQSVPAGADIPDSPQDPTGFAQVMQQIYGPPAVPCTQHRASDRRPDLGPPARARSTCWPAAPPVGPHAHGAADPAGAVGDRGLRAHRGAADLDGAGRRHPGHLRRVRRPGRGGSRGRTVPGGNGAWAIADLAVTPGAVYQINVGGRGAAAGTATRRAPGASTAGARAGTDRVGAGRRRGRGGLGRARRGLLARRAPAGGRRGRWRRRTTSQLRRQLPRHGRRRLRRRRRPERRQTATAPTAYGGPGRRRRVAGQAPAPGAPCPATATGRPGRASAGVRGRRRRRRRRQHHLRRRGRGRGRLRRRRRRRPDIPTSPATVGGGGRRGREQLRSARHRLPDRRPGRGRPGDRDLRGLPAAAHRHAHPDPGAHPHPAGHPHPCAPPRRPPRRRRPPATATATATATRHPGAHGHGHARAAHGDRHLHGHPVAHGTPRRTATPDGHRHRRRRRPPPSPHGHRHRHGHRHGHRDADRHAHGHGHPERCGARDRRGRRLPAPGRRGGLRLHPAGHVRRGARDQHRVAGGPRRRRVPHHERRPAGERLRGLRLPAEPVAVLPRRLLRRQHQHRRVPGRGRHHPHRGRHRDGRGQHHPHRCGAERDRHGHGPGVLRAPRRAGRHAYAPPAGAASPTPSPSPTPPARTATATPPAGPTATHTPAATATRAPRPPPATATPAPAGPPRASDGQHLGLQPAEVQAAFVATHGDAAAAALGGRARGRARPPRPVTGPASPAEPARRIVVHP